MKAWVKTGFEWADDELIGLWSPVFTGATGFNFLDSSLRNSNNGSLSGYASNSDPWVGSPYGSVLTFDGADDFATVTNLPSRSINDPISFSGWFWAPSGTYGVTRYFAAIPFNPGQNGVDFRDPSAVRFLTSNGTAFADVATTVDIRNRWTFLSGTWDRQTTRLYADGNLVGSQTWASTVTTAQREMSLGCFRPGSNYTAVRCSEVYIHYRALTAGEIALAASVGPGGMWSYEPPKVRSRFAQITTFKKYWFRNQQRMIGGGVR